MRIIAGRARGTKLSTPAGEITRPTSERAKEAIFSMLQFELAGRHVLDLFAGSGQLALEALSRGAADAVLCDISAQAMTVITDNVEKTHMDDRCRLLNVSYLDACRHLSGESFDLIFLDPPYAQHLICPALRALTAGNLISKDAWVIGESEEEDIFFADPTLRDAWHVHKISKYGAAHVTILRPRIETQRKTS